MKRDKYKILKMKLGTTTEVQRQLNSYYEDNYRLINISRLEQTLILILEFKG